MWRGASRRVWARGGVCLPAHCICKTPPSKDCRPRDPLCAASAYAPSRSCTLVDGCRPRLGSSFAAHFPEMSGQQPSRGQIPVHPVLLHMRMQSNPWQFANFSHLGRLYILVRPREPRHTPWHRLVQGVVACKDMVDGQCRKVAVSRAREPAGTRTQYAYARAWIAGIEQQGACSEYPTRPAHWSFNPT